MFSKTPLLFAFFFFSFFPNLPLLPGLPEPIPATIQPFRPTPSSQPTIPAFPEQSDISGCSLNLPDELFPNVKSACGGAVGKQGGAAASTAGQRRLHFSRCCPVLAAWLYTAYSDTALGRAGRAAAAAATSYEMPLLPDDSETCVDDLERTMKSKKMELIKPNETCDLVECYCGIRLHPLSCPEAFKVNEKGKLVGDGSVKKLERDCKGNVNGNGFPGLGGCSKCLNSLYQLHGDNQSRNSSKLDDRTRKMHNRDCQLMGLTWLLAKNRTAYIHTVSGVLRAIMMSTDGSNPQSCALNSDGLPLAVDSAEFSDQASANTARSSVYLYLLYMLCSVWFLLRFD